MGAYLPAASKICKGRQTDIHHLFDGYIRHRSQRQKLNGKQSLKRLFYTVANIGKSRETEKCIHLFPFLIFFYFSGGPCSLGINTLNISFSRAFKRAMCHFDLNSDIKKVLLSM